MSNEVLGFLCVVVIAVWSLLLVNIIRKSERKRKDSYLDGDLHR